MIRSFADTETERIWDRLGSRRFPTDIQKPAMRRLTLLDSAISLAELGNLPGNRLHALKDDRAGQHSISINMQWRICFVWKDGDAYDVEIADYH
ncbi:type II toxin-antitoxin system RelE/ParE family toxin [Sphingomonas sp. CA1-15]|uniref:Type II toxin-antitoxin system RelE/ParE family toxin n=2 Tax=Sphingomonas immobilis TaxID=3063997 RepID=A0ABT9A2G5_9SPHN|nr:type II toxin-antitoxin system RelE/ParE family toxin [Sphingomonas sp. CA1-15]MDO7844031.1 type II toxin-antitoxin system RelE/ParE family toxin [Sphingomonas sp. CA1-15]